PEGALLVRRALGLCQPAPRHHRDRKGLARRTRVQRRVRDVGGVATGGAADTLSSLSCAAKQLSIAHHPSEVVCALVFEPSDLSLGGSSGSPPRRVFALHHGTAARTD